MKKRYLFLIIILCVIVCFSLYYLNDYYHGDSESLKYLNSSGNVSVIKTTNGYLFDGPGNDTALIFYPGAKVEYVAYSPLMNRIAGGGVDAYLVEMPFNLAFFGENSADELIENSNYTHYVLAGHSLGGVMASKYASNHDVDGLVLLAAYPTENISIPVLSIYGENDKILNMKSYNDSKSLMSNLEEHIIPEANHAQFGNYGNQSGDGKADINSTSQQLQTAQFIISFADKLYN